MNLKVDINSPGHRLAGIGSFILDWLLQEEHL